MAPRVTKDEAIQTLKELEGYLLKEDIARVEARLEKHEEKTEVKFRETDDVLKEQTERFHGLERRQDGIVSSVKEVHTVATTIQKSLEKGHVNARVMAFFIITTLLSAAGLLVSILK